ncbi:MAG: sulfatase-like hydrolase/transferase [Phycisphaera sp.]|nr:sulfatase-like hydrolase/transferase [Phycisphaera sp.]
MVDRDSTSVLKVWMFARAMSRQSRPGIHHHAIKQEPIGMGHKRPNILLIMADQWHHMNFGFRGQPDVITPNLDRLRSQAIDFTHAYTQNTFRLPSRACILSGQYVRTHRQYGFTGLFDEHTPSLPRSLQAHGYHTFHVGKFHCNPYGDRLGFDEFIPTLPEDMYQATDPQRTYAAWCRQRGVGWPRCTHYVTPV